MALRLVSDLTEEEIARRLETQGAEESAGEMMADDDPPPEGGTFRWEMLEAFV